MLTHVLFNQVVLVALLSPVLSLLPYYIQVRMTTTKPYHSVVAVGTYEMPSKAGFHQMGLDGSLSNSAVTVARQGWI